jgi:pyruvate dehydrogenase E2 component (dihydrolipoamide acetyltransferase)
MTEGTVLGWLKQEGDDYRAGEELLEIETTKITNVMEAGEPGRLRRIVARPGATLPIGALLAVAAPDEVPDAAIDEFIAGFAAPSPASEEAAEEAGPAPRDIEAGGKRLRVLDLGGVDATPNVFVHGFGADLNTWMFNQPALAENRRAVALDLPGHGGSTKALMRRWIRRALPPISIAPSRHSRSTGCISSAIRWAVRSYWPLPDGSRSGSLR